jgi:plasmid replication initiation protein
MMEETKYLELRNAQVVKSNELIQKSRFNLSLQQQKIILYLISQIEPNDEDFKTYEFSITEFCRVCGISLDSGKNYSDLKAAVKSIADKSLWVTLANGDESLLRWIEKAKITAGGGTIQIRLDDDMKPFLLQLKENFTKYELVYTLHFKSKYTIRLYELVKSIHYHELQEYKRRYSVDDLRRLLGAETYPDYKNFKQRVLTPAIAEINEYSDKTLMMEEVRKGRKIVYIEFTIGSKDSLETLRIRDGIDKEMGMLPGQTSLWDELKEKGYA